MYRIRSSSLRIQEADFKLKQQLLIGRGEEGHPWVIGAQGLPHITVYENQALVQELELSRPA